MAEHDELCPFFGECPRPELHGTWEDVRHRDAGRGTGECRCGANGCRCDLIARVRLDERERAAERVRDRVYAGQARHILPRLYAETLAAVKADTP